MKKIFQAIGRKIAATYRTIKLSLKTIKDVWFTTRIQARKDIEAAFAAASSRDDAQVILDGFLDQAMNAFTSALNEAFGAIVPNETHNTRSSAEDKAEYPSNHRPYLQGVTPISPATDIVS